MKKILILTTIIVLTTLTFGKCNHSNEQEEKPITLEEWMIDNSSWG